MIRGGKAVRRRILCVTRLPLAPIACETTGVAPRDIIYASQAGGQSLHIWRMRPDGSDQRALTAGEHVRDNFPALSPDGTRILLTSTRGLSEDRVRVFIMDADGANLTAIGPADPAFVGFPSWSPDGRQILFSAGEDIFDLDLYVMNADGTGVRQLTSSPGAERCGEWAPDGSRNLCDWNAGNHFDLMTVDRSEGTPNACCRTASRPSAEIGRPMADSSPLRPRQIMSSRPRRKWPTGIPCLPSTPSRSRPVTSNS